MRTTHRGATIGVGLVAAVVLCLGLSPIAGAEPKATSEADDPLLESLDMAVREAGDEAPRHDRLPTRTGSA